MERRWREAQQQADENSRQADEVRLHCSQKKNSVCLYGVWSCGRSAIYSWGGESLC